MESSTRWNSNNHGWKCSSIRNFHDVSGPLKRIIILIVVFLLPYRPLQLSMLLQHDLGVV